MPKHKPKYLNPEEADRLLAVPNVRSRTGLRNKVALALMYEAGLRVSEVCDLPPGAIDWFSGQITVRGKGGVDRTVPVANGTVDILKLWDKERPKRAPTFLCTMKGGPTSPRYLRQVVDRAAKKAGLEKHVSPHMLRHSYATRLLDEGYTIREVQQLLGHANVNTTEVYTHVNPVALRAKIQGAEDNGNGSAELAPLRAVIAAVKGLTAEQRELLRTALGAEA